MNPGTLQMQITSLDYSSFVGRIAIGRVAPWYYQRKSCPFL